MPKMRAGFRDIVPSFRAQSLDPAPHPKGNGKSYKASATGINAPIIEYGGLIKVVCDIDVPDIATGDTVNWTDDGVYTGLTDNTRLPVFQYYGHADTSMELNGKGNFLMTQAYLVYGLRATGFAGPPPTCQFQVLLQVEAPDAPGIYVTAFNWGFDDSNEEYGVLKFAPSATDEAVQTVVLGNDFGTTQLLCRISVTGGSPVPLTNTRFRLVLIGAEF
jgi:hypothetical protein